MDNTHIAGIDREQNEVVKDRNSLKEDTPSLICFASFAQFMTIWVEKYANIPFWPFNVVGECHCW